MRDLARFPELVFLNRFDSLVPFLLGLGLFGLGQVLHSVRPSLGVTGGQMLVWGFFISTLVLFHATSSINSLAHLSAGAVMRPTITAETASSSPSSPSAKAGTTITTVT